MAWSYLSRIFSFSRYGSDGLGNPSSKSDTQSASRLPSIAASSAEHVLASHSSAEFPNDSGRALKDSPEPSLAVSADEISKDVHEAPNETPKYRHTNSAFEIHSGVGEVPNESSKYNLVDSAPEILKDIDEAPNFDESLKFYFAGSAFDIQINARSSNKSPKSITAELSPAFQPSDANFGVEAVLPTQLDTESASALPQAPPLSIFEPSELEPNLNVSQVSLLIRSARKPGNKSALKQVKSFFKKAAKTVRKKQTPAQIYIVDNWDSHSARSRRSSTFSLHPTTDLPSQLAESSSLPLASPKIFVDGWTDGIGFVFNDRWLAWTFALNNPAIILGSNGKVNTSWAELIAAELGILTLLSYGYRDVKVIVRSDNKGVVNALKTRTWTPNHGLDIILARILHLCEEARLELEVGWIPSEENPADGPSRGEYPPLDAMLDHGPPIPQYLKGIVIQVEAD